MFKSLLDHQDFNEFLSRLSNAIKTSIQKSNSLNESDLLLRTGFPQNWEAIE